MRLQPTQIPRDELASGSISPTVAGSKFSALSYHRLVKKFLKIAIAIDIISLLGNFHMAEKRNDFYAHSFRVRFDKMANT